MKHLLISFLLITLAFSSLRRSHKNSHHNNNSNSYSGSSSESSDYSNSYSGSSSDSSDYSDNDHSYEYSDVNSYSDSDSYSGSYSDSDSYSYSGSYSDSDSDSYSGSYSDSYLDSDSDSYSDSDYDFSYSDSSYDDSNSSEDDDNHRPKPDHDDFSRSVFKNLKKIERGILQDWRQTEDPVLKNEMRVLLIQNLENLLPIAEIQTESVEIQVVQSLLSQPNQVDVSREPHPRPPHPRPPQPEPEDEFANQVFETLHLIGQEILEQWNVEKDVEVKNNLRQNILEQLGALLPQSE